MFRQAACALSDTFSRGASHHRHLHLPEGTMDSPAPVHKSYQRFFAWTFMLAMVLVSALVWIELAFLPSPAPPLTAVPAVVASAFDLHDLQLLLIVSALFAAFASLAGLIVTTPLAWIDRRRARVRAALELAFKRQDHINWLAAEPTGAWPAPARRPRSPGRHRCHGTSARRVHGNVH
jgi:hypothetical protein